MIMNCDIINTVASAQPAVERWENTVVDYNIIVMAGY